MASVRITEDIRNHVRNKINKMFEKRLADKLEELQHLDIGMQVFMTKVDNEQWKKATELNATGMQWVAEASVLHVKLDWVDPVTGVTRTYTFTVPFKPPVAIPRAFGGQGGYGSGPFAISEKLSCYEHATKTMIEYDSITREREKLHEVLGGVFRKCGTLRQVLEIWPTALDYVPDGAKAQHALKTEPKAAYVAPVIDDEAKMLLMKARMLNPNA